MDYPLESGNAFASVNIAEIGGTAIVYLPSTGTLLASAAHTTAQSPLALTVPVNAESVLFFLNVTVASGTGGLTFRVVAIDPVSGNSFPLNSAPVAIIATGQYAFVLGPGCTSYGGAVPAAGGATAIALPATIQVQIGVGDASSYTYSVGYSFTGSLEIPYTPYSAGVSTLTDGSGTITLGGTAQTLFAALQSRRYLLIINNSAGILWINFTTAAVQASPSIQIPTGGQFVMQNSGVSSELISIIGATTGQSFIAKEL